MSSAASHTTGAASATRSAFVRSRLGSFLAVVPLAIWTVNHLWNNLAAFSGAEAWQTSVTEYSQPLAFFVSSVIALLPLALHTVWGLGRLRSTTVNVGSYPYFANVKYVLQRLSALGLVLFLGAHLWLAMIKPRMETGRPEPFVGIAAEMHHHLPTLAVYVLGVLGISYHLANGLQTFTMSWGAVTTRRALRQLDVITWIIFAILLAMGWGAVYALWQAGGQLPPPAH